MVARLSWYKIEEMFMYWCNKQSEYYVARMCHVAKNTVHKYRVKEGWDERLGNIKKRAREIVYNDKNGTL
ncbi:hypothetical protein CMK10_10770 [Candidatus Poribacteria bacterium]|nr:hypothetical protein [Candidatus Poribacteria bacterium]